MLNRVPRCIALHDLSCFGRCALTVVVPVLAAAGIQPCPLPTALLSTHSGVFTDYTFLDLTKELHRILHHWRSLELPFEYLYSGFLGSPRQVELVKEAKTFLQGEKAFYLLDPVLGDDGQLYSSLEPAMIEAMRSLLPQADVLTPNLTELFLLSGEPYDPHISCAKIDALLHKLAQQGPQRIVVTSCPNQRQGEWAHNRVFDQGRLLSVYAPATAVSFPGTGDLFASVLLAHLAKQVNFTAAVQKAMSFVANVLQKSHTCPEPQHYGVQLEAFLPELFANRVLTDCPENV